MIASLTGYVLNAATADPRKAQRISIPAGETATLNISIKKASDGTAYDITGGQLLLTVVQKGVILSRQATFDSATAGTAHFPLVVADTLQYKGEATYDVWFTDASGNRYQVIPASSFVIGDCRGQPAQPVTVPAIQQPLAQGPSGASGSVQGGQLTAAATITPTNGQHHITGATTITTISVVNLTASSNPRLTLIADAGSITFSTGGNIAAAFTLAQNNSHTLVYDSVAALWYP